MNLTAAYGLLAHALLCGALAALMPLGELRQRAALAATGIAMIGIAPGLFGAFGAPSATLLQLALLRQFTRQPWPLSLRPALALLGIAAVFYPLALGLGGDLNPYALGYQPQGLLLGLLPLAGWLLWQRQALWLGILGIDLLAYAGGLFPNLWGALFDPMLVLLAAFQVLRAVLIRRWQRRHPGCTP